MTSYTLQKCVPSVELFYKNDAIVVEESKIPLVDVHTHMAYFMKEFSSKTL